MLNGLNPFICIRSFSQRGCRRQWVISLNNMRRRKEGLKIHIPSWLGAFRWLFQETFQTKWRNKIKSKSRSTNEEQRRFFKGAFRRQRNEWIISESLLCFIRRVKILGLDGNWQSTSALVSVFVYSANVIIFQYCLNPQCITGSKIQNFPY